MKLCKDGFSILCILLYLNVSATSSNTIELVAKAVNSIGDFFSVNCIYFLSSSTSDIINQRLASYVGFGKSIAFSNFSQYYNLVKSTGEEQCQVPLRVILELSKSTIPTDFEEFNWLYRNYGGKIRSGIWVIFTKSFEDKFVATFFHQIFLPFDIEVMVAWIHNEMVHLKEVYQVAPSYALRQPYFGNYTLNAGLTSQTHLIYSRRTDLEGLQLKVAYIDENLPFTVAPSTGGKKYLGGYFGDIWHALEDLTNISSTYIKINLRRDKEENQNSWLQIMKMLKEKKIDAGLGDFIQSTSRVDYVDFSYPLLVSNFQVFYKSFPKHHRYFGHFILFGNDIWLALLIWTIINPLCHFCFIRIIAYSLQRTGKIKNPPTYIFMTFGGLCGQGWPNSPKFTSCKILFLLTYLVATVVIPSYTASLTRYLTSKPQEVIIEDLNDLYKRGSYKVIVVDGSYEYYFFNFSRNNENLRTMNRDFTETELLPKSYREAILLTCKDKKTTVFTVTSTLIWELDKAENAKLKTECSLRKMAQDAGIVINGITYPKNSSFRKLFDYHLRNLQNSGILDRFQNKYWKNRTSLREKHWESVSLKNASAIFHIIICGFILSSFIITLEQIIQNRSMRKSRKRHVDFHWGNCSK